MTRPKKTTTTIFTALVVAAAMSMAGALLLAPPGLTSAQMMQGGDAEEETQEPYALSDIGHAFTTMEPHVIYGENKTITFDLGAARQDPYVSKLDVQIALDFAAHSNDIMDAGTGPIGQVNEVAEDRSEELAKALEQLENGKFSEMFRGDGEETGPVGNVNGAEITPTFWTGTGGSIHPTSHGDPDGYPPVCGGGFTHPHPQINGGDVEGFLTKAQAVQHLTSNGFRMVPLYATLHFTDDYGKVVNAYGCNNGPFRDQGVIWDADDDYFIRMHHSEPNPEILGYWWPAFWWGSYVYWWHGP